MTKWRTDWISDEGDVDLLQPALAQLLDEDGAQEAGGISLIIQPRHGQPQHAQPGNKQELGQAHGMQVHRVAAHGHVLHLQRVQNLHPPQFLRTPKMSNNLDGVDDFSRGYKAPRCK